MAGTNTEKPTGKAEQKKVVAAAPKPTKKIVNVEPVKKEEKKKIEDVKTEVKDEEKVETKVEKKVEIRDDAKTEKKEDSKEVKEKTEDKKKKVSVKKVIKTSVEVNVTNSGVSTKYAVSICKFLKRKKIEDAISDLESVAVLKKAVPMKGEIPHRKGRMMSGRFPVRAAKEFIVLLKSLQGNANNHDVENPVIVEAIANKGTTTYGKMGRHHKKRTHIKIVAKTKKINKSKEKK